MTADKEVASRCADINTPWVTRAGRQLKQASKPSKSVHYTPELNLDEALSKADQFLDDISSGPGSLPSSSMSLRDNTIDKSTLPLEVVLQIDPLTWKH